MKTATALALAVGLFGTSALAAPVRLSDAQLDAVAAGTSFAITNKVADQTGVAPTTDPNLLNPWGLSQAPGSPLWVANNHSDTSTLYNQPAYAKLGLTVAVAGGPTGTVFTNSHGTGFQVSAGGKSGHALFLFATEAGTISGWSPSVNPTQAITAVDLSADGALFKGLAFGEADGGAHAFAADFANNAIDVFDPQFQKVGSFTDPNLPTGYAPFNVQTLNGRLYVAFAQRGPTGDEVAGAGLGFVDVFDLNGVLQRRLVSNGALNAPWGLTIAPQSFGEFAGALLVGNFGDGKVNAYNAGTGAYIGTLTQSDGSPLTIDGLWALRRAEDGSVVFSAGPNDETNGLIGVINPAANTASWAFRDHVNLAQTTSGVVFGH